MPLETIFFTNKILREKNNQFYEMYLGSFK